MYVISNVSYNPFAADQVKVAFKVFETPNYPGRIRADALTRALCTYGIEKLTEEQGYPKLIPIQC